MTITETAAQSAAGYQTFAIGGFTFSRDEYFATITWPTGTHQIAIDVFLRALQRDVAWGFFYGIVNFDAVFGTMNHYGNVDMFAGRFNDAYRRADSSNRPHSREILDIVSSRGTGRRTAISSRAL